MQTVASRCKGNSNLLRRCLLGAICIVVLCAAAVAQSASVSPTSLAFYVQLLNTTSSAKVVTITNTGTVSLSITSITTSGDFSQTNNCGSSLAGGAKCTINVTFTPTAIGTRSGTLSVNDNASTSPQTVALSGSGTIVSVSPTSLSFGSVPVGTSSTAQTVTVTNTSSNTKVTISGVSLNGTNLSDFSQTNTCGSSLSPSSSCIVSVTFKPTATGSRKATLGISDNGGASPQTVALTGTGSSAILTSIAVTPANPTVAAGLTQQFTATGTYSDGTTQNLTATATWSSSNTAVATVSNSSGTQGLATSVAQGTATMTATSGSISGSTTLTVGPAVLVSLAITPTSPAIALGTTQQLTATGTYSDGSTQNLTTTAIWSSSNTAVATISNATGSQGLATSVATGTTTITAISGSISTTTVLTVNPAAVVSIAVTPAIPSIPLGTTQQFTATGTFSDGTTQNITQTVQWSSSTTTVATISNASGSQGLASSVTTGSTTITATSGSVSGSTTLTVTAAALVSIAVTPANLTLGSGVTQQFTATGTYSDGSTQNLTSSATWASSATGVATINTTGLATTVAAGTTTISATSGSITGSTALTVTAATLVSIAVNPANPSIAMGTTQQFTATGTFSDGSIQDLTASAYWTSSALNVATISDSSPTFGLATSTGTGTTTITATSGSVSGTTTLTVTPVALVSIAVTPANPSIALGTTQQFSATGTFTDGSTQDLTTTVTWSSSTNTVAVISNNTGSQGLATSAAVGTTTITATSGSVAGSTLLTVGNPQLVSLAVTPTNPTIAQGNTQQFTATGTYTDGSTQDLTTAVTWTSSNTAVASITSGGLATGLAGGTSTIIAASGSISNSATLTVTAASPMLVSITVTPNAPLLTVGTTQQLTATGNYSDGSRQNLTNSATWTSTDTAVATVQSTGQLNPGLVTGVAVGTATIDATSGSITGSTSVTVQQSNNNPIIATVAGGGPTGVSATSADSNLPYAVTVDMNHNFYMAVPTQNRIYEVNSSGTLTVVAGTGLPGYTGDFGPASQASLFYPTGVAVDSSGNIYISDFGNLRIRKVDSTGTITTFAGDGECFDGDGTAVMHGVCYPWSIAVDSANNLYVADTYDLRVRKVDTTGNMTTIAGTGVSGFTGDGGLATNATMTYPYGVAVDGTGNVYIADQLNYVVRQVNTSGIITTVAGTPGASGYSGDGGPATKATLSSVYGIAADSVGDLLIADYSNQRIREVAGGTINTVAGDGQATFDGDGPATAHALNSPYGVAVDSGGNLYIADTNNSRIRKVSLGVMSTIAGNGTFLFIGTGIPAIGASLSFPFNAAPDSSGNFYIADQANHLIRKVDASGNITTVAGTGTCGFSGDGGQATGAQLCNPSRVAVSSTGIIFVADTNNHRVRQISLGGTISTIAGTGTCGFNGDGAATQHELCYPFGVTVDTAGNVYVADELNQRVRKIDSTGNMTTVAGNGTCGYSGDGGSATSAELCDPTGVATDSSGDIYIADKDNQRIRKVSSGTITTAAGSVGVCSFSGDGGTATKAGLCNPFDVAVDASGNIYIADSSNQRIREVQPSGIISSVAGNGTPGFSGDGVLPTSTDLCYPFGVDVDVNGNIFVADTFNQRIRKF